MLMEEGWRRAVYWKSVRTVRRGGWGSPHLYSTAFVAKIRIAELQPAILILAPFIFFLRETYEEHEVIRKGNRREGVRTGPPPVRTGKTSVRTGQPSVRMGSPSR